MQEQELYRSPYDHCTKRNTFDDEEMEHLFAQFELNDDQKVSIIEAYQPYEGVFESDIESAIKVYYNDELSYDEYISFTEKMLLVVCTHDRDFLFQ